VTGQGVREMLYRVKEMLDDAPEPAPEEEETVVIRPEAEDRFTIHRVGDGWRVRGQKIERVVAMTYFEYDATLNRFQNILQQMGITDALREAGVQEGDTVYIGDTELEWMD
jgi:GTP-binding protein